jgi:hypothetical protein
MTHLEWIVENPRRFLESILVVEYLSSEDFDALMDALRAEILKEVYESAREAVHPLPDSGTI